MLLNDTVNILHTYEPVSVVQINFKERPQSSFKVHRCNSKDVLKLQLTLIHNLLW